MTVKIDKVMKINKREKKIVDYWNIGLDYFVNIVNEAAEKTAKRLNIFGRAGYQVNASDVVEELLKNEELEAICILAVYHIKNILKEKKGIILP